MGSGPSTNNTPLANQMLYNSFTINITNTVEDVNNSGWFYVYGYHNNTINENSGTGTTSNGNTVNNINLRCLIQQMGKTIEESTYFKCSSFTFNTSYIMYINCNNNLNYFTTNTQVQLLSINQSHVFTLFESNYRINSYSNNVLNGSMIKQFGVFPNNLSTVTIGLGVVTSGSSGIQSVEIFNGVILRIQYVSVILNDQDTNNYTYREGYLTI